MTKVLCLCGYTQSAAIFRGRLAAIRKQCGPSVSFTFVDPPHIVHSVNLPDGSLIQYDSTAGSATSPEEIPRAWFFAKDVVDPSGRSVKQYEGMDEAWAVLKSTLEETTYDAVLGFSQGAAMAGALASRLASPDSGIDHPPFKLAVLVSGFAMQDPLGEFFPANNAKSSAATLHVIGRSDVIVSNERSMQLVDKFDNPRVDFHDGGHYVPSKGNWRNFFKALFESMGEEDVVEGWREVQLSSVSAASSGTTTPTSGGKL